MENKRDLPSSDVSAYSFIKLIEILQLGKETLNQTNQSINPLSFQNHVDLSNSQSKSSEERHSLNSYTYLDNLQDTSLITRSSFNFPPLFSSSADITRSSLGSYVRKSDYNHFSPFHNSYTNEIPFTSNKDYDFTNIYDQSKDVCNKKYFYIFEIQFKRNSRICMGCEDDIGVDIGDYVCVTGDRGIDIGKVINRKPCYQTPSQQPLPVLLNKANPIEISLLRDQRREENCVIRLCTQKAKQHNMEIVIVDAEFQFDRKKLTIYYYSHSRIDFRSFVKELYSIYYARIWMENIRSSPT